MESLGMMKWWRRGALGAVGVRSACDGDGKL